jgi:putative hemolysin
MTTNRTSALLAAAASILLLTACGSGGSADSTTSTAASASVPSAPAGSGASASATASSAAASSAAASSAAASSAAELEQHCTRSGGQVQTRAPYWNTNGDQAQWLALAGSATMCRFQADDEARSRIYVDLTTLGSTEPTLATLAYLSKVPMPPSAGGANPATGYCGRELNGSSSFGGAGAAGGGWVAQTDPDDVVVSLCVFPDGSFVDEWGLAYHSAGEIRGKDLTTVMRYQPSGPLPPVFPTSQVQPTS